MRSPRNLAREPGYRRRGATDAFLRWNRRLHYFAGLYLLFFCWLFAFTGLLLNHPRWRFAEFWPKRVQSTDEQPFQATPPTDDRARATDLMRQLGLAGEIHWPAAQPRDGSFVFQVTRPGRVVAVRADPSSGRATLERTDVNVWGVLHALHTFSGVPAADPHNQRDWVLTTVWATSMDAVAAGLIFMVFSSYVMWYRLKAKRLGGVIALVLGFAACGAFVAGFSWLL